jgi:hypothetical protein
MLIMTYPSLAMGALRGSVTLDEVGIADAPA